MRPKQAWHHSPSTTLIAVRIPDGLMERVREHRQTTGQNQTQVIVEALHHLLDPQYHNEDLPNRGVSASDMRLPERIG